MSTSVYTHTLDHIKLEFFRTATNFVIYLNKICQTLLCFHSRGGCGENGRCANLAGQNLCICEPGWRGPNCNKCQPYWACPNQSESACSKPNECLCDTGEPLCNNPSLTLLRK